MLPMRGDEEPEESVIDDLVQVQEVISKEVSTDDRIVHGGGKKKGDQ